MIHLQNFLSILFISPDNLSELLDSLYFPGAYVAMFPFEQFMALVAVNLFYLVIGTIVAMAIIQLVRIVLSILK